jgi:hypothetical protein
VWRDANFLFGRFPPTQGLGLKLGFSAGTVMGFIGGEG